MTATMTLRMTVVTLAIAASWAAGTAGGADQPLLDLGIPQEISRQSGPSAVLEGWRGLTDVWFMLDMTVILVLAVLLGAAIAYHPAARAKASTVEELEQPKTLIMYAMVGAVIGLIVPRHPVMGLVIFGIGGLMRFRTQVGPAKDTGRVILAVVVGVASGLKLVPVAILATAFGWAMIWALERQGFGRMQVKGLGREAMAGAAEEYRRVLVSAGCRILGTRKKFVTGTVTFVFSTPRGFDRETVEQSFLAVPEQARGSVDWDVF